MAIEPSRRAELNRRMEERRTELGLRWREVADAAGLTVEGLRGVRNGPSSIPAFTRRALERALRWPSSEIDQILGDLEPPMPSAVSAPKEWSAEQRAKWKSMTGAEIIAEGKRIGEKDGRQARIDYLEAALSARDERAAAIEDSRR